MTHVTPAETATPLQSTPGGRTLSQKIEVGMTVVAAFWILVCTLSALWLYRTAPLTAADLQMASWLSHPNTALRFQGVFAFGMGITALIIATVLAIPRKSPVPIFAAMVLGLAFWSGGHVHTVRVGLLEGHIKLGCYVEGSRECRSMLGLPVDGAASRYAVDPEEPDGGDDAVWYTEQLTKVVSPELAQRAALHSMPAVSFLLAPFYAGRADELNTLLARQRAEVAAMKAAPAPVKKPGDAISPF
jgi:hypothetical protein